MRDFTGRLMDVLTSILMIFLAIAAVILMFELFGLIGNSKTEYVPVYVGQEEVVSSRGCTIKYEDGVVSGNAWSSKSCNEFWAGISK